MDISEKNFEASVERLLLDGGASPVSVAAAIAAPALDGNLPVAEPRAAYVATSAIGVAPAYRSRKPED